MNWVFRKPGGSRGVHLPGSPCICSAVEAGITKRQPAVRLGLPLGISVWQLCAQGCGWAVVSQAWRQP